MVSSIVEAVALHAKDDPDKFCVADGRYELNYKEFMGHICGYAKRLSDMGIKKGDCIVVRNSQNVVQLVAGLAITLAGGIFVPIEKNVADSRILEIIDAVSAKLYIAAKSAEVPCGYEKMTEVMKHGDVIIDINEFDLPKKEDIAEILFTTGTTGKSKGIELNHRSVVAVAENVIDGVEMKKDNVEIIPVPLSHSHGLRRYYANMLNGSAVVILKNVVFTQAIFESIEKYNVTSMDLVPAALSSILQLSGDKLGEYKDRIEYIQLGSAPIVEADKVKLRTLLPNSRLYNFYGTTESGCSCIIDFNKYPDKKNCIGRPTCNANFVFIGETGDRVCATKDNPGLLACAGDMNMIGYYKEQEYSEKIIKNGYIQTEDLAYIDQDGMICLLGRQSDVIVTGGNKVSPSEVEDVVSKFDGLKECACVPVDNKILGKEPKLFVVMDNGKEFKQEQIYNYMKERLENYKVPKIIVQIDQLPRSYNGKILRRELV